MTQRTIEQERARTGVIFGIGAYVCWGLLPLYLKLLSAVPAVEVVAHRVLWSLLLLYAIAVLSGRMGAVMTAARDWRTLRLLMATAVLIAINWLVYIFAVVQGQVLAASLGYFINPLVNVALGFAVLGERLRPMQAAAVALAAIGVGVLAVGQGGLPWISLSLALSFGLYGLLRKIVTVDALPGLAIETALLAPLGLAYLIWHGGGVLGDDVRLDLLIAGTGIVTTTPLLLFAGAARRLRYVTLGLLQYIAPTMQLLLAVFLFGEHLTRTHIATFALIWAGLVIYMLDGARTRPVVPAD